MPDKKVVGKKDCAEWVTKRIPFSGAFFTFLCCYHKHFSKKEQNFHCSNGESGEENCCGCLKKWSESQSPAQKIIFYSNKG